MPARLPGVKEKQTMTQTLERLTRRTGTMRSIRGIVRTMKTMSAINALPYEEAARAITAYRETVLTGLHAFVAAHGLLPTVPERNETPIIVIFGSDHGLCGNYNELVASEVHRAEKGTQAGQLICVGAQMEDALAGQGFTPDRTLLPPANVDGLARLSGRLITLIDDARGAEAGADAPVRLCFMHQAARGRQVPVTRQLLPLDREVTQNLTNRPWVSRSLPTSGMSPRQLLAALVRNFLFAEIYAAAAEAMVTENAARLALMQQAERAIDERLEGLTGEMRQVRQSEITTELLDVIIGFEALKKRGGDRTPKEVKNQSR